MGSEWTESTLEELSRSVSYGYTESASSDKVGPHFLRITDIQNGVVDWNSVPYCPISEKDHLKYKLNEGDIVVARTGNSTGENYIFEGDHDAVFASYLIKFGIDDSLAHPKFVWYSMRSQNWWAFVNGSKTGSAQAGANAKVLGRFPVDLPPLPEQKAIAHILGTLDDKIELNRRMNATLEAMAQALFKSWFVDFDPVIDNALATGNPIPDELAARAEVRRQALADGTANREAAKLFPAAFKETESMGWIPEGWEHNTIGKLIEVTDYVANGSFASLKANVTLSDDPDYALYVRTTDFKHGFSLSKAKYTTKSSYDFLKKSRLFGDEIIISNVGDTGTVFRPPVWRGEPMTLGSNAIAVKTAKDCHYFYEYFRSDFGQHQISGIVGGSAQPKFNKTDFRSLHLHLPPQQIRKVYCESVECIWERHISVLRNNEALTKIRDTLLPKLISGELRIEDAERIADLETKEISS